MEHSNTDHSSAPSCISAIFKNFLKELLIKPHFFVCLLCFNLKDKKVKEQEIKDDHLHPLLKKSEKNPSSYKEPSSSIMAQVQNAKALLSDRKTTQGSVPEKGM